MEFITLNGRRVRAKGASLKRAKIDWDKSSRSKFQKAAKDFLRPYWCCDEVYEEFTIPGTRMSLDFYNRTRNIALEIDGRQHREFVPFLHKGSRMNFLDQLKRDTFKLDFCELNGIHLVGVDDASEITLEFFVENELI